MQSNVYAGRNVFDSRDACQDSQTLSGRDDKCKRDSNPSQIRKVARTAVIAKPRIIYHCSAVGVGIKFKVSEVLVKFLIVARCASQLKLIQFITLSRTSSIEKVNVVSKLYILISDTSAYPWLV